MALQHFGIIFVGECKSVFLFYFILLLLLFFFFYVNAFHHSSVTELPIKKVR
jgi:hypothetical protein